MFGLGKKKKTSARLEALVSSVRMNLSNNYKDAAQESLRAFEDALKELEAQDGALTPKQKAAYEQQLAAFQAEMKHFTHKDQKPTWTK